MADINQFINLLGADPAHFGTNAYVQLYLDALKQVDKTAPNPGRGVAVHQGSKSLSESATAISQQALSSITSGAASALGNAAGVITSAAGVLVSNIASSTLALNTQQFYNQAAEFRISFKDSANTEQVFKFSLLPAMEIRGGGSTMQVPDIKPGILLRTSMNVKRFAIPGAAPAFQVLGIEQTILQLVGLFIGNEGITNKAGTNNATSLYSSLDSRSLEAGSTAQFFDREVVQLGRPVKLYVYAPRNKPDAPLVVEYRCLIQAMRYFFTRSDRVYYAMEALVMDYGKAVSNLPSLEIDTNAGASGGGNVSN